MKKTLLALTLAIAIPAAALAARDDGPRPPRGPDVERLAERLDLDDAQRERVRTLLEAHAAEREALREKMRASLAEVLTPEQQARMEEMREKRREWRAERREHRRGRHCDDERRG